MNAKAQPKSPSHELISRWGPPLIVLLAALAAFGRSINFDFVFDDWIVLVKNPRLNPPTWASLGYYWTHIAWSLYMPLTGMTWAILARLGFVQTPDAVGNHLNPAVFHLANLLLHAAAALAALRLLKRLVPSEWAAAGGAVLFAVHPIQTEAVCFIGAMNNMLCGCFSFLAIADYLEALQTPQPMGRWVYLRGVLFFLLAMLSKPTAVVAPAIALVLDAAIHRRRPVVRPILPWIGVALPFAISTLLIQHEAIASSPSVAFRPIVAADAMAMYLWKVLVPIRFAVDYGRSPGFLYGHPGAAVTGLVVIALLIGAWIVRHKAPLAAASIAVFLIFLLPNSGLAPFEFQQYSTVADRYAYMAMLGPALAAAWLLSRRPSPTPLLASAVLAALCLCSIHQSGYWKNDRTLFAHAVAVNPESPLAHENLAFGLLPTDPAAAAKEGNIAQRLSPNDPMVHQTLGLAHLALGDRAAAITEFRRAVDLNPNDFTAHRQLGQALDGSGDRAGAIAQYQQCLFLDSDNAPVQSDLASALAEMGDLPSAIAHYQRALQIDPDLSIARQGMTRAEQQLNGGKK